MKPDSILARVSCSPALQALYARVRRIPLVGRLSHRLGRRALPVGTLVCVQVRSGLGSGLILSVDPRYEAQYTAGQHENYLLQCLASHLRRGQVLYDVGAHIGLISLVAARLVGPEGKIFAFEADLENSARILHHARINRLPQIEVIHSAVWSKATALPFRRASSASSRNKGAVLQPGENSEVADEVITIPTVTLDGFVRDHLAPAVIKIDVEGAEGEVLSRAKMLICSSKPILICEIHNSQVSEAVSRWLAECGYTWSWLSEDQCFPRHLLAQP